MQLDSKSGAKRRREVSGSRIRGNSCRGYDGGASGGEDEEEEEEEEE